jgi:hypothetical protein
MNVYNYSISIYVVRLEWHDCIKNILLPLIKGEFEAPKFTLNKIKFNIEGNESIEIEILVKNELAEKVLECINRCLSSKFKNDEYKIKYIVKQITQKQQFKLFISQTIATAIILSLGDEVIDDDALTTFAIYTLLACYKVIPDDQRLSIAEEVSAHYKRKAERYYEEIDYKLYQVKYHVSRVSINEIYIDVFENDYTTLKWLAPIENAVYSLVQKATNTKSLVSLFLHITDCIKDQLCLDLSFLIMINKFVFNILSENALKKSYSLEPLSESITKPVLDNGVSNKIKIPLLTYYSPSHESMFEKYFYPSYVKHLNDDFELLVLKAKQTCDAVFGRGNWNNQVKEKVIYVNNFIQQATCEFFLFSDVDIIFYKNIKEDLLAEINDVDIILQSDNTNGQTNNLCSGFYFCRVNDKTKSFFNYMTTNYDDKLSDQENLNKFLPESDLKYKSLSNKFYNFSHSTGQIWRSGLKIPFPEFPILMYHANYTVGNNNKSFLLEVFRDWDNLFFHD